MRAAEEMGNFSGENSWNRVKLFPTNLITLLFIGCLILFDCIVFFSFTIYIGVKMY